MGQTASRPGENGASRLRQRVRQSGQGLLTLPALALLAALFALSASALGPPDAEAQTEKQQQLVNLDFDDVELAVVIDTIAKLTGKNFIYDDRVRGRVTIVSPTPIPLQQAYTVFESVLQVKGFTTVESPGGVIKVIPIREAKESSIDTQGGAVATPRSDRFVTRLIPLSYIDAEAITNTLKPLVSKEAAMVAYAPTNTVILTDSASNIRRILSILEAIDVETYKEELAVIRLEYADAGTLAEQIGEIFGTEVTGAAQTTRVSRRARRTQQQTTPTTQRAQLRILTDERINALIVLAARGTLEEIRTLVRRLDVPVEGGGRIQVYYLKHADAEELAATLNTLLGAAPATPAAGEAARAAPQALRAAVTELAGAVASITSDPQTNSLVIQASPEGFEALVRVIEQLDIQRAQVLVEALIMEVDVNDNQVLGFTGVVRFFNSPNGTSGAVQSATTQNPSLNPRGSSLAEGMGDAAETVGPFFFGGPATAFLADFLVDNTERDGDGNITGGSLIQGIINAAATDASTNIISAPHILTSDNEEAEILVGDNIPIITSRVQAPTTGGTEVSSGLSTSVNVERQDIGVTLRVTPQITEGDTLRLQIFQEITDINNAIQQSVGNQEEVGVALSNRRIENTVVVADNETVVIGGLVSDDYDDNISKVPWLGDIPFLGWLFKSTRRSLVKRNLLIFLTPHIIRTPDDLEAQSIRKREEFRRRSEEALEGDKEEKEEEEEVPTDDISLLGDTTTERNPTNSAVNALEKRYPLDRMREIEREQKEREEQARAASASRGPALHYEVLAAIYRDAGEAQEMLTELVDAGYDGTLLSGETNGSILFELRLGPYDGLDAAQKAADGVRRAYGLAPQVVVEEAREAQ